MQLTNLCNELVFHVNRGQGQNTQYTSLKQERKEPVPRIDRILNSGNKRPKSLHQAHSPHNPVRFKQYCFFSDQRGDRRSSGTKYLNIYLHESV